MKKQTTNFNRKFEESEGPSLFWYNAKLLAVVIFMFWCIFGKSCRLYGQSKCDRPTYFSVEAMLSGNQSNLNSYAKLGVNVIGSSLTASAGAAFLGTVDQAAKTQNIKTTLAPIASIMYRVKFNGYESKVVHGLVVTGSTANYTEFGYRLYAAPTPNSFATIGGAVNYSKLQGVTVGFTLTGFL